MNAVSVRHLSRCQDDGGAAGEGARQDALDIRGPSELSDEFKGNAAAEKATVEFAYLRETIPGTLLRFEAMRLPSRVVDSVRVSGSLLDDAGKVVWNLEICVLTVDCRGEVVIYMASLIPEFE